MTDSAVLNRLLFYDAETGRLWWRKRSLCDCASVHAMNMWNARSAGKEAFTARHPRGYRIGAIKNKSYIAHRVIWCMVHGEWPDQIDHINGERSDNRLFNLRSVNNATNHKNVGIPSNNTSGVSGVSWSKKERKWLARITVEGDEIRLVSTADFHLAVSIRKSAERHYKFHKNHGDRVRGQT